MWRNGNPLALLVGMQTGASALENIVEVPQKIKNRGVWVAQLVRHLTLAQVMISQFMCSSPASGSVLTAQRLEPASDSLLPSLSAPPMLMLCLSVSLSQN